ncbi:hypothetical protein QA640_29275 [Bradyrhizobium sp. CB82]|uniref:hypothetical protein n=1 Tax=Bradyrhizobium sp. CB82 TaxID=3039159 RepID=UPI0024B079E2|nr:hypothetical protein [Bradyrhizobium sp. CB82]WFU38497.1 hypothetical protein QA640_29275 [Bradyrhizobium sp. CB82]
MKILVVTMAVGAAALAGGSTANAASNVKADPGVQTQTSQSTDFSSRHRYHYGHYYRHYGYYRHYRHYGYYRPYYRSYGYRPYYGSYGYYPRSYGYYGGGPYGYYGGGPGVSFSFGTGW